MVHRLKRFFFVSILLLCLSSFGQVAKVDPKGSNSDQALTEKVQRVLSATGWYPDLEVQVSEGLVFLRGASPSAQKTEWAVKLIKKMEGVAEVVDNTEPLRDSNQVLNPAIEEARLIVDRSYKRLPYLVSSLAIIILFSLLGFLIRKTAISVIRRRKGSVLVAQAMTNLISMGIVVMGLYLALRASGLSGLAFTVLGGTGVMGIGLGLALKSSFENYASGIMISVRDLIRKGEIVQINGVEGFVQAVTSRGTSLMDYEGNNITIPNSEVFNATIKNFTRNPNMRAEFNVGIGYDDSIDHAKEVISSTLRSLSHLLLKDPEFLITVEGLGSATVNLRVYFWFDAVKYSKLKIRSYVMQKIKEALMREEISMPDDAREVVFRSPLQIIQKDLVADTALEKEKRKSFESKKALDSRDFGYTSAAENIDLENEWNQVKKQALQAEASEKGSDLLDSSKQG